MAVGGTRPVLQKSCVLPISHAETDEGISAFDQVFYFFCYAKGENGVKSIQTYDTLSHLQFRMKLALQKKLHLTNEKLVERDDIVSHELIWLCLYLINFLIKICQL